MEKQIPYIHEPNYADPKEPYAFFGLAAYYAQCFEQSLILLLLAARVISSTVIKKATFDEMLEQLDRKTLGLLIKDLRKTIQVDETFADLLSNLPDKRNYLMHHYFLKNAGKGFSDTGRRAMLDELREIAQSFQDGGRIIVGIYEPLWQTLGLTEEIVEAELEKIKTTDV